VVALRDIHNLTSPCEWWTREPKVASGLFLEIRSLKGKMPLQVKRKSLFVVRSSARGIYATDGRNRMLFFLCSFRSFWTGIGELCLRSCDSSYYFFLKRTPLPQVCFEVLYLRESREIGGGVKERKDEK